MLLLHAGDGERLAGDGGESLFALRLGGEFPLCCRERSVAVYGSENPVRFRLEVVYLLLAVHYECECGRLHSPY